MSKASCASQDNKPPQLPTPSVYSYIKYFFIIKLSYFFPDSFLLIPLLDDARGVTYGNAHGWDVVSDGGVATDDATVTDSDARQDGTKFANPDVVLDDDGLAGRQGALGWRHGRAVGMCATVDAVVVVGDVDFAAHEDVIADLDVVNAADMDVLAETHVVTDDEARREVLLMLAFTVRGDGLHPESSAC